MSKGTPSKGKRNKQNHIACRRCGSISFHLWHKICSKCGFGRSSRMRAFDWMSKRSKVPTH